MLSPEMREICAIVSGFSITTNRHGWLFSCEGARPAASSRMRWCSSLTGSGRNPPLVVLRRRMASSSSMGSLPVGGRHARAHDARDDEGGGGQRDERMPRAVRAEVGDRRERRGSGEQGEGGATARTARARPQTGGDGSAGGDARRDVEGVVHPAE